MGDPSLAKCREKRAACSTTFDGRCGRDDIDN